MGCHAEQNEASILLMFSFPPDMRIITQLTSKSGKERKKWCWISENFTIYRAERLFSSKTDGCN